MSGDNMMMEELTMKNAAEQESFLRAVEVVDHLYDAAAIHVLAELTNHVTALPCGPAC
jgi:hypothetical protein